MMADERRPDSSPCRHHLHGASPLRDSAGVSPASLTTTRPHHSAAGSSPRPSSPSSAAAAAGASAFDGIENEHARGALRRGDRRRGTASHASIKDEQASGALTTPSGGATAASVILMGREVRKRSRGRTTITSKHQVTIPADAFVSAGLAAGDSLQGRALGPGRILFERVDDSVAKTAGIFDGIYPERAVDKLRDEWG